MPTTKSSWRTHWSSRRNELEVRQDIYTWDTLAWVLYKNGQMQAAVAAMKKALALNTNDPLLLFHAGMIYHSLGHGSRLRAISEPCAEGEPALPCLLCRFGQPDTRRNRPFPKP